MPESAVEMVRRWYRDRQGEPMQRGTLVEIGGHQVDKSTLCISTMRYLNGLGPDPSAELGEEMYAFISAAVRDDDGGSARTETALDVLLELQRRHDLADIHLVNLREDGFDLAHTNAERAALSDLSTCPIHDWLSGFADAPAALGLYRVLRHEPDTYSEPYRAEPYDLEPLDLGADARERLR